MIDAKEKELLWQRIQIGYAYEEELGLNLQGNISIVILEAKAISPQFIGETLVVTVAAAIGYNRRIYKNTSPALVAGNREKLVWNESFNFPVQIRKRKGHPGNMISVFLMRKNLLDGTCEVTGNLDFHLHDLIHAVSEATWHPIYHNSHYMMDLCIMHCFAYGTFGYGISHQLKLEEEKPLPKTKTSTLARINTKTIKKYLEKTMYPQLPVPPHKLDANSRTIVPRAMSHPFDYIPFIEVCEYNLGAMSRFTYVTRPKERPMLKDYMLRLPRLVEYLKRCSHLKDRLAFIHQVVQDSYLEDKQKGFVWKQEANDLKEDKDDDEKEDMDVIFDDIKEQKIAFMLSKYFHPIKKNKEAGKRMLGRGSSLSTSQRTLLDNMSDSSSLERILSTKPSKKKANRKLSDSSQERRLGGSALEKFQRFKDYCYIKISKCLKIEQKRKSKPIAKRDQENDIVRMVTTVSGIRDWSSSDDEVGEEESNGDLLSWESEEDLIDEEDSVDALD